MAALYIVATPIGNLSDLSLRAAETLRSADLILAEDTRVTRKLLAHLNIRVPLRSNHRHNEREQAAALAQHMLENDLTVALVSDAGTPGISDPGAALVDAAAAAGIPVMPVAGPSAVVAALSVGGFEGAGYAFYGFPPRRESDRVDFFRRMVGDSLHIAVLFESPHRICSLVESVGKTLPDARLCLCCDLTKKYESILRGAPTDILCQLQDNPKAEKGEYVLVLDLSACPRPDAPAAPSASALILEAMLEGASLHSATRRAQAMGISRNEAYQASLKVKAFLGRE